MKYSNIMKNNAVVYAEDKIVSKKDLFIVFEKFISDSGYSIEKVINSKKVPYEFLIVDENKNMYRIVVYLKNITGAGWVEKPGIKRVQVSNIRIDSPDNYVGTHHSQTLLILGYYNYDNNPIMVAWDAYRYVKHNTVRSCYVNIDNLKRGYISGYHIGTDSSQKLWIFDSFHFDKFLKDYIEYNSR